MFANGANKCKYFEPGGVFILFTLDKHVTVEINLFIFSADLLDHLDLYAVENVMRVFFHWHTHKQTHKHPNTLTHKHTETHTHTLAVVTLKTC